MPTKFSELVSTYCPLSLKEELLEISMIYCRQWHGYHGFYPKFVQVIRPLLRGAGPMGLPKVFNHSVSFVTF